MTTATLRPQLILFCKQPRPGYGKQRLAATIGDNDAYAIAQALLKCALEDVRQWPGVVVISPASSAERSWAEACLAEYRHGAEDRVEVQNEGNLGERLAEMDERVRAVNAGPVMFMGSDAPTLTHQHFAAVTRGLEDHDVVLADGSDGGVTLMASGNGWPEMADLPWSTSRLGDALYRACVGSGRSALRVDGGADLDEACDIPPLRESLAQDARPARRELLALLRKIDA